MDFRSLELGGWGRSGGSLLLGGVFALALGDGLMESPPARNWYCGYKTKPDHFFSNTAQFKACSTAFNAGPANAAYNFMSVVTNALGRAEVTPLPKHVCSFDSKTWSGALTPWDVPMDWPTTPMSSGMQNITWNAEWGAHYDDTRDFSYWITKADFVFSPTRELTWNDFETAPFCVELYDDKNPTANPNLIVDKTAIKFTTRCNVPARSGRHVIYGEWGRRESTFQRFHGCVDVSFASSSIRKSEALGRPHSGLPFMSRIGEAPKWLTGQKNRPETVPQDALGRQSSSVLTIPQ